MKTLEDLAIDLNIEHNQGYGPTLAAVLDLAEQCYRADDPGPCPVFTADSVVSDKDAAFIAEVYAVELHRQTLKALDDEVQP